MSKKGRPELPTSPARRAAFLEALRNSGGVFAAACRATAYPGSEDKPHGTPPAYSTWRSLMARDPDFSAQVEAVMEGVRDDIEGEIYRRAQIGTLEPVFQKGEQATDAEGKPAFIRRYSDRLLIKRAAALMPERYGENRTLNINHNGPSAVSWAITSDDLALLTADEKETLAGLIATLRNRRPDVARLEHNPPEVIEAEFEEVEAVEEREPYYSEIDLGAEALAELG